VHEVENVAVVLQIDVGGEGGMVVVVDARHHPVGRIAQDDDTRGIVVDAAVIGVHLDMGGNIVGGDGNAAEPEALGRFTLHVACQPDRFGAMDYIVVGIVAARSRGIGENHAAASHQTGVVVQQTGAHPVGEGASLHVRTADVDDVDVAVSLALHLLPLVEECAHRGGTGIVAQHIRLAPDKRILLCRKVGTEQ